MSRPVGAHIQGRLRERYEAAEEEEQPQNKSDFLRSLLREGLDAREKTTYEKAGLPERLADGLEEVRASGDREEDVLREVVEEGLRSRKRDVLDAIDASDELRTQVETVREDDETLEAALRRLVRVGAEASTTASHRREKARGWAEWSVVIFVLWAFALAVAESWLRTPSPVVPITANHIFAGSLFFTLVLYVANNVDAWRARRGDEDSAGQ